jgi:predicted permease
MTPRPSPGQATAFRLLLLAYPAWFRRAHGAEMAQLFEARLARTPNALAVAVLWARTLEDTWSTAVRLRRRRTAGAPRWRTGALHMWAQDVRFGLRQLVRTPIFTLGAVALLAVGLGANIAVFTVVDAFVLRGLPYARPGEVVHIYQDSDNGEPSSVAFPAYRDMAASPFFRAVAATSPAQVDWDRDDGAVAIAVEFTTASYLDVTGLTVQRGQWFSARHDVAGSEPVAVVSAAAWRTRFGSDPDIVGRSIRLNGHPVTIIGVGPERLSGSFDPIVTDLWLSISANFVGGPYRVTNLDRREDHWYDVRARLAPGVTAEAAQAAMTALAARFAEMYPNLDRGRDVTVRRAEDVQLFPETRGTLSLASAIAGTLLLLAAANLANLVLVRGIARSGEVAVRRALGAGTARIGRLFLIESLCLSAAGGVAGLVLAQAALAALPAAPLPPPFSRTLDVTMDARAATFAAALMIVTGVLFGLAPALRLGPGDIATTLRDDRRTSSLGRGTLRLRNALTILQVAGSLVLLVAAGLLGRSLVSMQMIDPGVDPERVAYVRPDFSRSNVSGDDIPLVLEEMRARVAALPGVTRSAVALRLPAQRSGTTSTIVEGYEPRAGNNEIEINWLIVTAQYFDTVGQRLLEGRGFAPTDVAGADRVVVINQAAARRYWGDRSAIGGRLRSTARNAPFRTVVGVVEDAPVGSFPERPVRPMFYASAAQSTLGSGYVLARTDGDADALATAMRTAIASVRSTVAVPSQGTLSSHFGAALARPRFLARVMGAVSLLAVILAALGIYAVVAFNVAKRSSEMGIRLALGATSRGLVRMIVRETVGTVAIGLAAGLALAILAVPRLESLLFDVRPVDLATFAGAVALLTGVAWLAAYVPARRTAGADPGRAFRAS